MPLLAGSTYAETAVAGGGAGAPGTATASCPAGKVPVGGGYDTAGSVDLELIRSGPTASATTATTAGWYVRVTNEAGTTREVIPQAGRVLAG